MQKAPLYADEAQLAVQFSHEELVAGSNPVIGTMNVSISYLKNAVQLNSKEEVQPTDRVFYELGYYIDRKLKNWIRTGEFKEIENVAEFLEKDKHLDDIEYIRHHNFMILRD